MISVRCFASANGISFHETGAFSAIFSFTSFSTSRFWSGVSGALDVPIYRVEAADIAAEFERFAAAVAYAQKQLQKLRNQAAKLPESAAPAALNDRPFLSRTPPADKVPTMEPLIVTRFHGRPFGLLIL